jgi:hypothetical protein
MLIAKYICRNWSNFSRLAIYNRAIVGLMTVETRLKRILNTIISLNPAA